MSSGSWWASCTWSSASRSSSATGDASRSSLRDAFVVSHAELRGSGCRTPSKRPRKNTRRRRTIDVARRWMLDAFLDELTRGGPDTAACLVGVRELRAREPRLDPFPEDLPELVRSRLGLLGIEGLYPHQSRGLESLRSGKRRDPRDRHRERQDARVRRRVRRGGRHRPQSDGPVSVPDEGARARSASRGARPEAHADPGVRLRRRHAEGRATADPEEREPRADEPRHAPPLDPSRSREVGRLLLPALADRDRRGARVPRGVRVARRDGASASATADRALRREPALVSRERDGRQSRRARVAADRPRRRRRRGRRRTRRRQAVRPVEPPDRRRGDRAAAERAGRGIVVDGEARGEGRPDDRVHEVAAGRGAARGVHTPRGRRRGPPRPDRLLPRRATSRRTAGRSSAASRTETCSPSPRPPRSSSGSTSAPSMPPC